MKTVNQRIDEICKEAGDYIASRYPTDYDYGIEKYITMNAKSWGFGIGTCIAGRAPRCAPTLQIFDNRDCYEMVCMEFPELSPYEAEMRLQVAEFIRAIIGALPKLYVLKNPTDKKWAWGQDFIGTIWACLDVLRYIHGDDITVARAYIKGYRIEAAT